MRKYAWKGMADKTGNIPQVRLQEITLSTIHFEKEGAPLPSKVISMSAGRPILFGSNVRVLFKKTILESRQSTAPLMPSSSPSPLALLPTLLALLPLLLPLLLAARSSSRGPSLVGALGTAPRRPLSSLWHRTWRRVVVVVRQRQRRMHL